MEGNAHELKLFLVVLGGRTKSSNIEVHDVRWVVGETIEQTIPQLKEEWFGESRGLHIDSYLQIKFIDEKIISIEENKSSDRNNYINKFEDSNCEEDRLWFVNLGGYKPNKLLEIHQIYLLVARTKLEAKRKAKKRWASYVEKKHNDDLYEIDNIKLIENIELPNNNSKWKVKLVPDPLKRNQTMNPDWYGYWKIDKY